MCALFQLYASASQYKEATELGVDVLPSLNRLLGTHHRVTLLATLVLAEAYLHLDQRSKSLEMYEWLAEVFTSSTSRVDPFHLWVLHSVKTGFSKLGLREKTKSLAASLVDMSQDCLGPEDPETQQWVRWLHFHEFWCEANAMIEDPTEPITSALLDRLVATGTELLDSIDLEIVPEFAEDIAIIRQRLQSEAACSHEDRAEIVRMLRGLESNLFIAGCRRHAMLRNASMRIKRPTNSHELILSENGANKESDESLKIKVAELFCSQHDAPSASALTVHCKLLSRR